ncbi:MULTISPECIES: DUF6112 family protein [Bifidobacterium]|jgi:hypothetical protein|nr:DUF6112 family protein [Bifidobacterium tibiigranuli]
MIAERPPETDGRATRGRTGVLVALGVAVMAGGVALLIWLVGVGERL